MNLTQNEKALIKQLIEHHKVNTKRLYDNGAISEYSYDESMENLNEIISKLNEGAHSIREPIILNPTFRVIGYPASQVELGSAVKGEIYLKINADTWGRWANIVSDFKPMVHLNKKDLGELIHILLKFYDNYKAEK